MRNSMKNKYEINIVSQRDGNFHKMRHFAVFCYFLPHAQVIFLKILKTIFLFFSILQISLITHSNLRMLDTPIQ